MSSDSLSSPTYEDDLAVCSFQPRQASSAPQALSYAKFKAKKDDKSKSASPTSPIKATGGASAKSNKADDDSNWFDIPGGGDTEMQLMEDFRARINLLFSSDGTDRHLLITIE